MKKLVLLLLAIWQLLSFQPLAQAASQIPAKPTNNIYVQDYSHVLSANTKATITAYSQAIAAKTKAQIVVVTIPTLNGDALEDYATTLYRSWGIGDKEKNNGVLLLVVTKDRKSRIEVGYGLEGALPDGLTGRIQDQYMAYTNQLLGFFFSAFNKVINIPKIKTRYPTPPIRPVAEKNHAIVLCGITKCFSLA